MKDQMNVEALRFCLKIISKELYKADPNSEELEALRKSLLFQVEYIRQRQAYADEQKQTVRVD